VLQLERIYKIGDGSILSKTEGEWGRTTTDGDSKFTGLFEGPPFSLNIDDLLVSKPGNKSNFKSAVLVVT